MARDPHDNRTLPLPPSVERTRIQVDISPSVALLLDHIAEFTGQTKSSIVAGALLDAIPDLLARADLFKKRVTELNQAKGIRK